MTPIKVPFADIIRYEPEFLETLLPKVEALLRKGHFTGGPQIAECEAALASFTQSRFVVGCANGTDALQLALRALGVGAGDSVLLPDMTFWASFEAIVNVGARPITLDVDVQNFHLRADTVEEAIKKFRPKALILVHLYGWAAPDTEKIRALCLKHEVLLLEDSAQAFGTLLSDKSLIGEAQIATTSFYPAKVLGASGDAGAVFTKSTELKAQVAKLRDHGRLSHYEYDAIGWNSRFGAYEATFLTHSLDKVSARIKQRRNICETYRQELAGLELEFCPPSSACFENGYASVARLKPERRSELQTYLQKHGIESRVIYPGAMSRQPGAKNFLLDKIDYGHADLLARSVISLPCFAGMRESEIAYVVEKVRAFS